jgi:hypothetical protein
VSRKGQVALIAKQVPDDLVATQARAVYSGPCPVCGQKRGPVGAHTSHKIASFLVLTSWSSIPRISCNACGTRSQAGALAYSLFLGWWGLPWGWYHDLGTDCKESRGYIMFRYVSESIAQLEQLVRNGIAARVFEQNGHVEK